MRAETSAPVLMKLQAATRGIHVGLDLRDRIDALGSPQTRADGSRAIEVVLPGDIWVSAAVDSGGASSPLLSGSLDDSRLECDGDGMGVRVVLPRFYQQLTSTKRPMWQVLASFGSFLAVNPSAACSFGIRGAPCRFCRAGTPVPAAEAFPMPVADVVESVRAAFDEGRGGPVYFNTGYLGGEDSGLVFLEPYIRAVKRNFATVVAVQMHPPKTNVWIDRAYAMGVDAISYGIDIHDPTVLQRQCPGRIRFLGRERYYEALAYAATIFPKGTVWSELVVGIEAVESTRQGIETLARDGVLPVLSPMRAASLSQLRGVSAPAVEEMVPLIADLYRVVRDARIPMGWVRGLSFAVTPFEARALSNTDSPRSGAVQYFYRSRLSSFAARNLSRVRRQLRLREDDEGGPHSEP